MTPDQAYFTSLPLRSAAKPPPIEAESLFQMIEPLELSRFNFLGSLADAQRISLTALTTSQRDLANLACPTTLHHDAVQTKVRMLALDRRVPPSIDLGVDLSDSTLSQADPGCPQRLRDVLDRRTKTPARYVSISASSTELIPPAVAFDNCRWRWHPTCCKITCVWSIFEVRLIGLKC
jgi:hypothetical protein